jgi:hypothetical protein
MSEWLGKQEIREEDIKKVQPSLVEFFPMLTKFFVDDQKMRIVAIMDYDKGAKFREIVTKVYGAVTPSNVKQAAEEAIDRWMKDHS